MVRRLLVVEDEVSVQELLAEYLRGRGFEVDACGDGASAMRALVGGRYRLLVTDLRLPDAEGLDLVKAAWALDPPLPSLVMSGFATVEAAVAALTTGAVDVLLKPFRLRDAHTAVERALGKIGSQRECVFRLAVLEWYERLALAPEGGDAAEAALADLHRLVALHRPEVRIEVGPGPAGPGWSPLGLERAIRPTGEERTLRPAFAALNTIFQRARR